MLSINWDDVFKMLQAMKWPLIAIGVFLLLAIIVTIAVRKTKVSTRKFARAQAWIAFCAVALIAANLIVYGPMRNVLNLATGKGSLTEETVASTEALGKEVADEGMVLLKNTNDSLPLAGGKVNVLGWASSNPVYGGTGSGSMSDAYEKTTLLDGLHNAGIETNDELTKLYTDYRKERPEVGMFKADWTLPEVPMAQYSQSLIDNAKSFSDTAVVVVARSGGEGYDLPADVNKEVANLNAFSFTDNSSDYKEFEDGDNYLQFTRSERDLLDFATKNFDNVILVLNGANAFELGEVKDNPDIDSIIWAIPPGQVGFDSLGQIIAGKVNPSGKTPDTILRDITTAPAAKNAGSFVYDNMNEFKQTSFFTKEDTFPSFVNYVEGIYVGYKFWETAAVEGAIDYDKHVAFPFGYGLSYTQFKQELGEVKRADGKVSVSVTVTNTGDKAGKDVVELYSTPPYTNGGIEKAAVNLIDFGKTKELTPGESETLNIEFPEDDLASYDENGAKAYVLEAGDYVLSLRSDSHTVLAETTLNIADTITYNTEAKTHGGDLIPATNQFDMADNGEVTFLSRADKFANLAQATAAPSSYSMSEEQKSKFVANQTYKVADHVNSSDQMPTTGADNGLVLGDLAGADYDDPRWEQLLDQMTIDEMDNLMANGGYQTPAVKSVGKVQTIDVDGPASLNNNFTGVGSIGLPVGVAVAATWNQELALRFGEAIGQMAHEMNVAGWYAPAMNIHRTPLSGRNFEYFSEDGQLSGLMAASEVKGAQSYGVYAFIKHFALNDQETNRNNMLTTWATEQSIREIYLKPFEHAVKDGKAHAVMSSFNYIGPVYAGATPQLLQTVLRDEWGFQGFVLTDYFGGYGYQNADQIIRGGGDAMLATVDITNHVTDRSATSVIELRRAAKNILYAVSTSWIYENGQPEDVRPAWEWVAIGITALAALALIAWEVMAVRKFLARRKTEPKRA